MIVQPGWAFIRFGIRQCFVSQTISFFSFDGAAVVITTIDCIADTAANGDTFFLLTEPDNVAFHAGKVTAPSDLSFPWRGELIVPGGNSIRIDGLTGTWDIWGSGYLVPNTAANM